MTEPRTLAITLLKAGAAYGAIMFAVGFLLGALRVVALGPWLGEVPAVALEIPVILAASWLVCRRLIARYRVPPAVGPRVAMGVVAFALLQAVEIGLALVVLDRSPVDGYGTTAGVLGLLGQIAFAAIPLAQTRCKPNGTA